MDNLLEQNIFDDDFVVFNNDIPYDKRKININAAIRHYNLSIASKSEIALIKKKFKVIQK